jgi:hypothetical protein
LIGAWHRETPLAFADPGAIRDEIEDTARSYIAANTGQPIDAIAVHVRESLGGSVHGCRQ